MFITKFYEYFDTFLMQETAYNMKKYIFVNAIIKTFNIILLSEQ